MESLAGALVWASAFRGTGTTVRSGAIACAWCPTSAPGRATGWLADQGTGQGLPAADLLRTVAVAPTLNNVYVLGLIVVIRTFLSFSLETEIEGVAPWRRALAGGAGTIRRAAASALGPKTPP